MEPIAEPQSGPVRPGEQSPFLVVRSCGQGYAVPTDHVRDVGMMPRVSGIPGLPPELRGVTDFRGEVVPVVDLRVLLGAPSREQEIEGLCQLLREREQDHRNWLKELEASVREGRRFTLARDPHLCKFGRWYDSYQPEHAALAILWSRFDRPHRTIHALADQVLALTENGDTNGALALIEAARGRELNALINLFAEAGKGLREDKRELAVVLGNEGRRISLAVDSAEAVEDLAGVEFLPLPDSIPASARRLVTGVMRWPEHEEMVLCLDPEMLIVRGTGEAVKARLAA